MTTLESLTAAIEAVKDQKKAVKGQPAKEKALAEELKALNLQRAQILKTSGAVAEESAKKLTLKVPKVRALMLMLMHTDGWMDVEHTLAGHQGLLGQGNGHSGAHVLYDRLCVQDPWGRHSGHPSL